MQLARLVLSTLAGLILLSGCIRSTSTDDDEASKAISEQPVPVSSGTSTATPDNTETTPAGKDSETPSTVQVDADGWAIPQRPKGAGESGWGSGGGTTGDTSGRSGSGPSPKKSCHFMTSNNPVVPDPGPAPVTSADLTKEPEKDRKLSPDEETYRKRLAALVLDPAAVQKEFSDRPMVGPSYEIAKSRPDVLRRLFCYCGCDITEEHTSLLDCFTAKDKHGATCSECIDETFLASKLLKNGATMGRIQQIVDEQFCDKYPFPPNRRSPIYKNYLANRIYSSTADPICGDKYSGE